MTGTRPTRRILVAVDDSEGTATVVDFVNRFFAGIDAEVIAVNAGRSPIMWGVPGAEPGGVLAWPYWPQDPLTARDAVVREAEATIATSGLHADDAVAEVGDPAAVIAATAAERDVDLVVVGAHHRGFVDRLLHGSVSQDVLKHSPVPVLVVPC